MMNIVAPASPYDLRETLSGIASLDPPGTYVSTAGRTLVSPRLVAGQSTAIIIIAGQSMSSNNVPDGSYTPTQGNVHNLNIADGGMYQAAEPLLGCGGTLGNFGVHLCDLLRADFARVILVPIAIGSTSVAAWAPGGVVNNRIGVAVARMRDLDLLNKPDTYIIWGQGEVDNVYATPAADYEASLRAVKQSFVAAGCNSPMIVAVESRWALTNSATVRSGQAAVVDGVGFLAGPDLDAIPDAKRAGGGGHFLRTGAVDQAALWDATIPRP